MRKELENIALIDRFIAGDLSSEELQEFNTRVAIDADFKEQVEIQQDLKQAMNRAALRKEVLSAQQGFNFTAKLKKWGMWSVIGLTAAGSAFFFLNPGEENDIKRDIKNDRAEGKKQDVLNTTSSEEAIKVDEKSDSISFEEAMHDQQTAEDECLDVLAKIEKKRNSSRFEEHEAVVASNQLSGEKAVKDQPLPVNGSSGLSFTSSMVDSSIMDSIAGENYRFTLDEFKQPEQTFTINPDRDTIIFGKEGLVLQFPAGCLQLKNRRQPVEIKIREFVKLSDMILEGLTTTSNGDLLETGGMAEVRAYQGGKEISLKDGEFIRMKFPVPEEDKSFQMFRGEKTDTGIVNWHAESFQPPFASESKYLWASAYAFRFPKYLYKSIGEEEIEKQLEANDASANSVFGTNYGERGAGRWGNRSAQAYPHTFREDGLEVKGNTRVMGKLYHRLLEKGCLPTGTITFQLSNTNKVSNYEEINVEDNCSDSLLSFLRQVKKWRVAWNSDRFKFNPLRTTGGLPKKKIVILDLDYRNQLNHPTFGPMIKDIMADRGMKSEVFDAGKMFKVVSLGYVNCDRFTGRGKILKSLRVKHTKNTSPVLIYKKIRSILMPWGSAIEDYKFAKVPIGYDIALVSIVQKADGVYVTRKDTRHTGIKHQLDEPKRMSETEFKQFLKDINQIHKRRR